MLRPGQPGFFGVRRLLVLMHALPSDARSVRVDPDDQPWGMTEELLAQLLELTSVYASERRITEPIQVPRPWDDIPPTSHAQVRSPARRGDGDRAARPVRRGRGDTTPVAGTTIGLGAATVEMAAWAARNGGAGGNGAAALGYGTPPRAGGES